MSANPYHLKSEEFSPFGEGEAASQVSIASRSTTSLCGAPIKAAAFLRPTNIANKPVTDETTANDLDRHATVGGIVIVAGLPYALTVAQPFAAPIPIATTGNTSEDQEDVTDEKDADSPIPSVTWYEDAVFQSTRPTAASSQSTSSTHPTRRQHDVAKRTRSESSAKSSSPSGSFAAYALGTLGVSGVSSLQHKVDAIERTCYAGTSYDSSSDDSSSDEDTFDNATAVDPLTATNWALVALDDALLYPNTYTHIASGNLTTISKPQTPANLGRTEKVLVLAGKGKVKVGVLDRGDMGSWRHVGDSLGLWRLDARLERYEVGSWVVKGEMLLGVVVAVNCVGTDWVVSRAYVMPVEGVFASIRRVTGVEDVRLPKYNEVEGFRRPAQEVDEDWILLSN